MRRARLPFRNGRLYDQPSAGEKFHFYLYDSYGPLASLRTIGAALLDETIGRPQGWDQNFTGFGQRLGSGYAVSGINGTVRYGLSTAFHEDVRYLPCHGCTKRQKIENALLAEVTARHGVDGHRQFSLTPFISDETGPIIARSVWYPPFNGPLEGVSSTRYVVITRVGVHIFREFLGDKYPALFRLVNHENDDEQRDEAEARRLRAQQLPGHTTPLDEPLPAPTNP